MINGGNYIYRTIKDVNITGKRLLIRVDMNVPLQKGVVSDDARIVAALPTLHYALQNKAALILMTHLGRPKEGSYSMDDDLILDFGPRTMRQISRLIHAAKTVVWNGPIGVFELSAFAQGTKELAQAIAKSDAFSIAGGGDTLAAMAVFHVKKEINYISTGGGAFLEFLAGKSLPAVQVLSR